MIVMIQYNILKIFISVKLIKFILFIVVFLMNKRDLH